MRNHDVICISSIDWDFLWQGQQEIMSRLAQQGNSVLYIENTGVRRPRFGDLPRIKQRLRNWWQSYEGIRQEAENLYIFSPLVLPFPYSRPARWINRFLIMGTVRRWMRSLSVSKPIVWSFLPTPLVLSLIKHIDASLLIYYRADDFRSSSPQAQRIWKSERAMLCTADLIFVYSRELERSSLEYNPQTHRFPFAVNLDRFQPPAEGASCPVELVELPRPIIGYVGGVNQKLDLELLAEVAERSPNWSFVFVGSIQSDPGRLAQLPNVHLLGARPHEQLASYIAAFDAALIPYVRNRFTDHVYPAKLNEYLAIGAPVVSTSILEVTAFREEHGPIVAIADTPEAYCAAIADEIAHDDSTRRARRRAIAAANTWAHSLEGMSDLISARLEQLARERAKGWQGLMCRVLRRTYARAMQVGFAAVLLYVLIFESPLMWWLARPLVVSQPPQRADAIVVLAGGVGETGRPGTSTFERAYTAAALYQHGWSKAIVLVSGFRSSVYEANDMQLFLTSLGIPNDAMVREERGVDTYRYALLVAEQMQARRWSSALLISSPYHMRRAMLTFKRHAPHLRLIPTPVVDSNFYAHRRGITWEQLQALGHEVAGIVYYWWRGRL